MSTFSVIAVVDILYLLTTYKMTKSAGMLIVHSTRAFASFSLFAVKLDDSFDHNIVILNMEKVYHEVCSSLG